MSIKQKTFLVAGEDPSQVEEIKKTYGLSESDVYDYWLEAGHGLCMVSYGVLPEYTSFLIGFEGTKAFNSSGFYAYWDIGVNWQEEGPKYAFELFFAGIIGGAWYSGFYDWAGASSDMKKAGHTRSEYSITYRQAMAIWMDCH